MKVIMIDQDGVVSNRNYQTTKDIRGMLSATIASGDAIVPNSRIIYRMMTSTARRCNVT